MHPVTWAAICAAAFSYALVSSVLSALQADWTWTFFYAAAALWAAFEGISYLIEQSEVE